MVNLFVFTECSFDLFTRETVERVMQVNKQVQELFLRDNQLPSKFLQSTLELVLK